MTKTKVVFRKLLEDNSIIAVFPEQHWNAYGDLASYQHTGQHGAANVDWLRKQTRLATPEEYKKIVWGTGGHWLQPYSSQVHDRPTLTPTLPTCQLTYRQKAWQSSWQVDRKQVWHGYWPSKSTNQLKAIQIWHSHSTQHTIHCN